MSYSATLSYDSASALSFDTTLVEIGGGVLRLKDLGGGTYSTASPSVTSQHQLMISALSSFAESSSLPASTSIKYIVVLNGLNYWYNTTASAWQTSDGTVSQSNTAAQINSNASTLISGLGLLVNQYFTLKIFLITTLATNRPSLTSNTVGYSWTNGNPAVISQCLLYGYLSDLIGTNPIPSTAQPITLYVSSSAPFWHGSRFVTPFSKSAAFDNTGYVQLSVIETATPGMKLKFSISYYDGSSLAMATLYNAIVPNQPTVALNSLSAIVPSSVG